MRLSASTLTWLDTCGLPLDGWQPTQGRSSHLVRKHDECGVFLKQFSQLAQFRRERNALRALGGCLSGVPHLLHHHEGLQVTVTAAANGTPLPGTQSPAHPIWAAAGQWLARLHGRRAEPPLVETDVLPLHDAVGQRAVRLLHELAQQPERDVAARFEYALRGTCWPSGSHDRVPCHRDFEPRNWLWSAATHTLTVVDFEHARADAAAFDVVKVLEISESARNERWTTFLGAYEAAGARVPDPLAVRTAFVHHAAFTWMWGRRHQDADWVRRGMRMLVLVEQGAMEAG